MSTRTPDRWTGSIEIIALPEAQILASGRILTPDEVWSPTDGANKGKHKGGNGVDIYQNLVFWEDTGSVTPGSGVQAVLWTVQNGMNVTVDNTDPANPVFLPTGVNALLRRMNQANTFTQGQALKTQAGGGGVAALAQGNSAANAEFVGFYYNSTGSLAGFDLLLPGSFATIFSGLTAGEYHYLNPAVAGGLTPTPNAFGPVLKATSTTGGYVLSNSAALDVAAALALKAPLASPALTGTPTAPTATDGDLSTQIANTTFVWGMLSAPVQRQGYITDSGNVAADPETVLAGYNAFNGIEFINDGDQIELEWCGTFEGSTSSKRLRLKWAGTTVFDMGAVAIASDTTWRLTASAARVDNATVRITTQVITSLGVFIGVNYAEVGSLDFSTTNYAVSLTGEASGVGAANNDIVVRHGKVLKFRQPI